MNDYLRVAYMWRCIDAETAMRSHCIIWVGRAYKGVTTERHLFRLHANEKYKEELQHLRMALL